MLELCLIQAGVGWQIVRQIASEVLFIELHSDIGGGVTDPILIGPTVELRVAITVLVVDLIEGLAIIVRPVG